MCYAILDKEVLKPVFVICVIESRGHLSPPVGILHHSRVPVMIGDLSKCPRSNLVSSILVGILRFRESFSNKRMGLDKKLKFPPACYFTAISGSLDSTTSLANGFYGPHMVLKTS